MAPLLLPCALAALALGIVAGDGLPEAVGMLQPAAVAAVPLLLVGVLTRWRTALLLAVVLGAAALGAWREATVALPTGRGSVAALVGTEQRELSGTVVDDPRPKGERQQVVLDRVEALGP